MTASVHSLDCSFSQTPAVMRNGMTTEPNTHSARKSKGALVRAFQDCGYTTIGRSVGHDKSWVCRWLSGDGVANLPEVLHMLDTSGLRIVHEDDLEAGGDAELIARMERVLDRVERDRLGRQGARRGRRVARRADGDGPARAARDDREGEGEEVMSSEDPRIDLSVAAICAAMASACAAAAHPQPPQSAQARAAVARLKEKWRRARARLAGRPCCACRRSALEGRQAQPQRRSA